LKAYLAINPGSASAWLALAREEQQAGGTGAEALAKAESVIAARVQLTPWSGSVQALRAEHLRLAGKLAEAAAAAELATKLAPTGALGWYVRSLVAEAAGNADVAADARKRAARVGPVDPLYASLARGS
jgi:tetratricopeptide (TPR) repeat protein